LLTHTSSHVYDTKRGLFVNACTEIMLTPSFAQH